MVRFLAYIRVSLIFTMRTSFRFQALSIVLAAVLIVSLGLFSACKKDEDKPGSTGLNLFSVEDDIKLGQQLDQEIASNPQQYPILDPSQFAAAYQHLQRITNQLLNSGQLRYRDRFAWQLKIIRDDNTLNAFCAPGGYIYVYTGLIKFLDRESELAGVMGHEIAHADLRHSTEMLTRNYGVQVLLEILLGGSPGTLANIATNLALLSYSRGNETEADMASVAYLCSTEYDPKGTAGFFQKLVDQGQGSSGPAWLSTHPAPDDRVQNINAEADRRGCQGGGTFENRYLEFKQSLP